MSAFAALLGTIAILESGHGMLDFSSIWTFSSEFACLEVLKFSFFFVLVQKQFWIVFEGDLSQTCFVTCDLGCETKPQFFSFQNRSPGGVIYYP
jgi:hypothetical protein